MVVRTPSVGSPELALELPEKARAWQGRAREFAEEVVRPVGQVLDRMDAQAAVAPGSPVHDFLAQAHREGFTRLTDPPERGGAGLSRAAEYLVLEELAAGDAGLAAVLIAAPLPFRWAHSAGTGRRPRDIARPFFLGGRTDWSGCCAAGGPPGRLRATREGGGWLLAGSSSAWTGTATATHAVLACAVEAGAGDRHVLAIVPLDRAGVSRGPALDVLGLRTQARAQLLLDGVHIADDELLGHARALSLVGAARALAHASIAVIAVGIGRAAYEGTLRFAREHVRGGRPLVEHPDARRRLARMFTLLEASRTLARAAHLHTGGRIDAGQGCSIQHAAAAHAFVTETACEIVDGAMDLCGGRADARAGVEYLDGSAYHPEKLLRDAQSCKVARPAGARPTPLAAAYH